MGKKEKLIKRIKSKPKDFTYNEAETLFLTLGLKESKPGKTSGSRVRFLFGNIPYVMHKPHPRKELLPYQINEILDFLERNDLI